ncbi:class I SAM-dependent methyltransferase [Microvirga pakistanensis]|uniref:class I SAM-dependent methyltransferase n=1 Tax=Microvirga pakistanensis TaxID=1682650 RepID=UPI00106BEDF1|nr:methyltransferase domain-containing protein [Microvirga pakistanensis]
MANIPSNPSQSDPREDHVTLPQSEALYTHGGRLVPGTDHHSVTYRLKDQPSIHGAPDPQHRIVEAGSDRKIDNPLAFRPGSPDEPPAASVTTPMPPLSPTRDSGSSVPDVPEPQPTRELVDALLHVHHTPVLTKRYRRGMPNVLVCAAGQGTLGIRIGSCLNSVVVVHPDPTVIEAAKARPVGSYGAIMRTLEEKGPSAPEIREHPIQPGVRFIHASPESTGLPDACFDLIIVEQAYRTDLSRVAREMRRIARPGAAVIYMGYMPMRVGPEVDDIIRMTFDSTLNRFLTPGERHLFDRFRSAPFPFVERAHAISPYPDVQRNLLMRAKWNLFDFVKHLNDWPVIRRIEERAIEQVDVWQMRSLLAEAWGAKRRKREITWPVILRVGFVE